MFVILGTVQERFLYNGIEIIRFALQHLGKQYRAFLLKANEELNCIKNEISKHESNEFIIEEGKSGLGVVTGVVDYGAFIQLNAEKRGLLHISNMGSRYISCIFDEIKVGDKLFVKISRIDGETGKVSLIIDGQ